MKLFIFIPLFFVISSCRSQSSSYSEEKEIVFDNIKGDSTVVFYGRNKDTLCILRKIEILENDNSDTVTLGYAIIPPHFKGYLYFIQDGLDKSKAVYIDRNVELDPHSNASYAKLFTISMWRKETGIILKRLKLKIWLKETMH